MRKRSDGFFKKSKSVFVAVLLSGALFGAAPAMAGPVPTVGPAWIWYELIHCDPITAAIGPYGLHCWKLNYIVPTHWYPLISPTPEGDIVRWSTTAVQSLSSASR